MMPTTTKTPAPRKASRRSDMALAVLAAAAMVAFAWSGFQSAEWVRERFLRSDDAASLSEESLELSAEADRIEEKDAMLYVEWRVALDGGDLDTAAVIFDLFRPELQAYVGEVPVDDQGLPVAPPFDDPGYDAEVARVEALDLDAESDEQAEKSRAASENGARYGGLGLVFASVLATVGIASRFDDVWIRRGLTVLAGILFALGGTYLVLSPLSYTAP